jgi:hypothetical protein
MILPGKHIKQDRALIAIGGDILAVLDRGMSVSEIWRGVQNLRESRERHSPLSFDWFVLALTFLFAVSAVVQDGDKVLPARAKR